MIEVQDLSKHFRLATGLKALVGGARARVVQAVDGVSFTIADGEVLGLVGESGCGKSTIGRLLVGLEDQTAGAVRIDERDSVALRAADRKAFHKRIQMVFQDPYGSLNPQHTISEIVARPLLYQGAARSPALMAGVADLLEEVGLSPASAYMDKFPHQISGGQRQRVCIARAIVLKPSILIADEPISMLDVSIKWGVIRLLKRLVRDRKISLLYITHDLATVSAICDRIAIMYLGRIVETGPVSDVLAAPRHPYSAALVSAIPSAVPGQVRAAPNIKGTVPDAIERTAGCGFAARCPYADARCHAEAPPQTSHEQIAFTCFRPLAPAMAQRGG